MKLYEMNGIVYADNNDNEIIKIKQVYATNDYKLHLKFSTGEKKVYDAKSLIEQDGVFKKLKDIKLFKQAFIDYDTVVWNDLLDISPEFLYENSNNEIKKKDGRE